MTRRTIRRYAHELYPHPDEWEVRPLSGEPPVVVAADGWRGHLDS